MAIFPETPLQVLARMASQHTGERESAWRKFFELYEPVIETFVRMQGAAANVEDIVQEVFVKLVKVFEQGTYDRERGKFRTYLSVVIKREVIDYWRRNAAKAVNGIVSLDDKGHTLELSVPPIAAEKLDAEWAVAKRAAAVQQVLEKTALSSKVKQIYRAYAVDEEDIGEVAKRFGTTRNYVSQIKHRLDAMVDSFEKMMSD